MTRINLGIEPAELCDQHLVAEYRELPRIFNFAAKTPAPEHFKLGSGHVKWCAKYLGTMKDRQISIVEEMKRREFTVNFSDVPTVNDNDLYCSGFEVITARALLQERINERLNGMKRISWTKTKKPDWVRS